MALFSSHDRRVAEAIAGIAFGNPFLPERIAAQTLEQQAVTSSRPVLISTSGPMPVMKAMFPSVATLHRLAEAMTEGRRRQASPVKA